ncbi:MAG: cytochrome B [Bacteroidetes bacterium]|nr:cytochrome B [Bacteroidota bacterium]
MHQILVVLHSVNRFVLLALLLLVLFRSLKGWLNKSPFTPADDNSSLGLFISTHTQFLLGFILFFISPAVIFSGASMKDPISRYWLVEHSTGMIIAVVLITLGRILSKKVTDSTARHKKTFIFNAIALLLILGIIAMNHRGFFSVSW